MENPVHPRRQIKGIKSETFYTWTGPYDHPTHLPIGQKRIVKPTGIKWFVRCQQRPGGFPQCSRPLKSNSNPGLWGISSPVHLNEIWDAHVNHANLSTNCWEHKQNVIPKKNPKNSHTCRQVSSLEEFIRWTRFSRTILSYKTEVGEIQKIISHNLVLGMSHEVQ